MRGQYGYYISFNQFPFPFYSQTYPKQNTNDHINVLQVCDKAFARRDKLVIHMNKFKHVTPTNIAPLGKRLNNLNSEGQFKSEIAIEKQRKIRLQIDNNKFVEFFLILFQPI